MSEIEIFALSPLFNFTEKREFISFHLSIILCWQHFVCSSWKWMRFTEWYRMKQISNIQWSFNLTKYCLMIVFYKLNDHRQIFLIFNNHWMISYVLMICEINCNCICNAKQSFKEILVSKWYLIWISVIKRDVRRFFH